MESYDLIIIGSGPAGITAGIYAAIYNLKFLVIGKLNGGAISEAHKVCNYPSQYNITGFELTNKMVAHLSDLGGKILNEEVREVIKDNESFLIKTNNSKYKAKKIILAIGRVKEKLNIKGEDKFLGRGVSYCATCDSAFFKNKTVAVVGGGNAAVSAALLLAEHAKKIYIIHRKDKFARVDQILLSRLEKEAKITIIFNSEISEINGEKAVTGITLKDNTLAVDGVFIEIGFSPPDSLIRQLNLETENKYVRVDKFQRTSLRGVFAVGDITNNPLKQVITACSEGSIATTTAYDEIRAEMAQIAEI